MRIVFLGMPALTIYNFGNAVMSATGDMCLPYAGPMAEYLRSAGVEAELGVRLVNRKVPLTLTYAGDVFLGYARRFQALRTVFSAQSG